MKSVIYFITVIFAGLVVAGCGATIPPTELVNARQAYQRASTGQAAQLVPAELHKAQIALDLAEKSFLDDPDSYITRDLAYVADRKSMLAEALAITFAENTATEQAKKDYETTQAEILVIEQKARKDAEIVAAGALADFDKLSAKADARGLIITLSGSVLFASNASTLLPAAQEQLNQVADALLTTKDRKLTIEGHTDSQGSSGYNQELAQRRADAVRSYLISRGYSSDLIQAVGIGEDRPVTTNDNAEGRANNRRVEIVVTNSSKL
jgi:outer membrane protein OmpA-like peptidoglycan-associated protein